jgi:hypothetical protein
MINDHAQDLAGKPVKQWEPQQAIQDPTGTVYRIALSYEESEAGETWEKKFAAFLIEPAASEVTGIVVGLWSDTSKGVLSSSPVIESLVAAREKLPNLRALFIGDIISEEFEISWIEQTDVSPIFAACPELEHFRIRGGNGLRLGQLNHDRLKSLIIETGGLDVSVVRDITSSNLPELEHLELWLGDDAYGANTEIVDLAPIFSGRLFPKLKILGLRDSQLSDAIAVAVSQAPLLGRLRVLDLSLGTLSDAGAAALLSTPSITWLDLLDIHHHYCSDEMVLKLEGLGVNLDASDPQSPDDRDGERYVAVSE